MVSAAAAEEWIMQVAFEAIHIRDKTLSFTKTADWTSIKMNKDFPREVAGWGLFFFVLLALAQICQACAGFYSASTQKYEIAHE